MTNRQRRAATEDTVSQMLSRGGAAGRPDPTTLPFHAVLASAYFVIFLFAGNLAEQLTLGPLWGPLLWSMAGAVVTLGICIAITRDARRGGILATLLIVLFFTFGHIWYFVDEALGARRWLLAAYALVAVAGAGVIWRGGGWVAPLTRVLNIGFAALVAFNGISIGAFILDDHVPGNVSTDPLPLEISESTVRPDIYYIVLDRYANSRTLETVYGHDNAPFLDELRSRAFTISEDAWANYFKTHLSLTSSLGMDFVDGEALASEMDSGQEFAPINARLNGPLLGPITLQSIGYEYVHIGSWYPATATNATADVTFNYGDGLEFSTALAETTALSLLAPPRPERTSQTIYTTPIVRGFHEYSFDQLEASAARDGPTFVFAHFQLPHPPYVYKSDGSVPGPHDRTRAEAEQYVEQVKYVNSRVLAAIDAILAASDTDAVVALVADEGPFPDAYAQDERGFSWLDATPEQISQKFGILHAMRLPGVDAAAAGLHERSSPINVLRIILNEYFDADLQLLRDSVFISPSHARPYDFVPYERSASALR